MDIAVVEKKERNNKHKMHGIIFDKISSASLMFIRPYGKDATVDQHEERAYLINVKCMCNLHR